MGETIQTKRSTANRPSPCLRTIREPLHQHLLNLTTPPQYHPPSTVPPFPAMEATRGWLVPRLMRTPLRTCLLDRTSLNQQAPRANPMDPGWIKEAKQVGQLSRAANDPSFYPGAAYGHGGGFYGGLYGGGSRSQYHGGAAAQNMRMAEQQLRYGSGQGF